MHTRESEHGYLYDDKCPQCGDEIKWVRVSSGSEHNADCRKCMVIWQATPVAVKFELTPRPAKLSEFGAMIHND